MSNKKEYKVSDLYQCVVGPVYRGTKRKDKKNDTIYFNKEKGYITFCTKGDYRYYDVVSQMKFRGFNESEHVIISQNMNDYYVVCIKPLFTLLSSYGFDPHKETITHPEIIELYDKLNKINEKTTNEQSEQEISNPFLKQVLNVRTKINDDMEQELKDKYIKKLKEIATSYSTTLIEHYDIIKDNPKHEIEIMDEYLSLLCTLEGEIEKANQKSGYSMNILDELQSLKNSISGYQKIK